MDVFYLASQTQARGRERRKSMKLYIKINSINKVVYMDRVVGRENLTEGALRHMPCDQR